MIAARQHSNLVRQDLIDESVLIIDTLGPASRQITTERFGLADAAKRIGLRGLDQPHAAHGFLTVLYNPPSCVGWDKPLWALAHTIVRIFELWMTTWLFAPLWCVPIRCRICTAPIQVVLPFANHAMK